MDVMEFKLGEWVPGFRMCVRRDSEMSSPIYIDMDGQLLSLQQSLYVGCAEGRIDELAKLSEACSVILYHTHGTCRTKH